MTPTPRFPSLDQHVSLVLPRRASVGAVVLDRSRGVLQVELSETPRECSQRTWRSTLFVHYACGTDVLRLAVRLGPDAPPTLARGIVLDLHHDTVPLLLAHRAA